MFWAVAAAVFIGGQGGSYTTPVHAAANPEINYQGKLTDNTGATVADGTYNVRFFLYTVPSGGSAIWQETASTTVTNGLFSYLLGSTSPLTGVNFNQPLYLGVEVGGTGSPTWDGEMTPRKVLGTVPAAFEARQLDGLATTSFLRSDQADSASGYLTFLGGASTTDFLISGTATTTNLHIAGSLFDVNNSAGFTGYVLQRTASGLEWVATSTLGFAASSSSHDPVTLAGTPDYLTLTNQELTLNQLDLADDLNSFTSTALLGRLTDETGSGSAVFSDSPVFSGNVGVGTSSPASVLDVYGNAILSGANRYLNFGDAAGSSGYGLRDTAGSLQYKDLGGSWASLGGPFASTGGGTPFDVSTASFVDSFSVSAQEAIPQGLAFNTDGTKMFVVGNNGDDVNEYTLTTGFDVSTASFVDSFSVSAQEANPTGLAFSADGTKMFVTGSSGDDVNEYTLTTAFDVSTASFVDSFSVATQETTPTGLAFNTDGTKMFVTGSGGDAVNEYTLTTAFDVSTASFVDSFSVATQETSPQSLAFNTDGTKMFVVGSSGQDVNEYTIPYTPSNVYVTDTTASLGIGTTNPSDKLHVVGDIRVGVGTTGCVKDADGTTIAGTCSSDLTLKTDIVPLIFSGADRGTTTASSTRSMLAALVALEPVTYRWNDTAAESFNYGTVERQTGLIAQQVQETLPELVTPSTDGYLQVRFSELPIYIIQALKELWQVVAGHDERINTLEAEVAALRAQLASTTPATTTDSTAQPEAKEPTGASQEEEQTENGDTPSATSSADTAESEADEPTSAERVEEEAGRSATSSDDIAEPEVKEPTDSETRTNTDSDTTMDNAVVEETPVSVPPAEPPDANAQSDTEGVSSAADL